MIRNQDCNQSEHGQISRLGAKPGHDAHQFIVSLGQLADSKQSLDEHEYQHLRVKQQHNDQGGRGNNDQRKGHDFQQEQDYVECVTQIDDGNESYGAVGEAAIPENRSLEHNVQSHQQDEDISIPVSYIDLVVGHRHMICSKLYRNQSGTLYIYKYFVGNTDG